MTKSSSAGESTSTVPPVNCKERSLTDLATCIPKGSTVKGVRLEVFSGWAPFPALIKVTWYNLLENLFVKRGGKNS